MNQVNIRKFFLLFDNTRKQLVKILRSFPHYLQIVILCILCVENTVLNKAGIKGIELGIFRCKSILNRLVQLIIVFCLISFLRVYSFLRSCKILERYLNIMVGIFHFSGRIKHRTEDFRLCGFHLRVVIRIRFLNLTGKINLYLILLLIHVYRRKCPEIADIKPVLLDAATEQVIKNLLALRQLVFCIVDISGNYHGNSLNLNISLHSLVIMIGKLQSFTDFLIINRIILLRISVFVNQIIVLVIILIVDDIIIVFRPGFLLRTACQKFHKIRIRIFLL